MIGAPRSCCPTRPPTTRVTASIRCCSTRRCSSLAAAIPAESPDDPAESRICRRHWRRSGCSAAIGRRARCHTELVEPGAGRRRPSRPDRPHRRHRGPRSRSSPASAAAADRSRAGCRCRWSRRSSTPNGWRISTPSDGDAVGRRLPGSWLLLADDRFGDTQALVAEFTTRFSSPTRRVISASCRTSRQWPEAFAKSRRRFASFRRSASSCSRRSAVVRRHRHGWRARACARLDLGDLGRGARCRRRLDGKSPRLWLVTRDGLAVHDDEPGDPAIGALKGLIRNWRFPGEAARVLAGEPDLGATLVDLDSAGRPSSRR